MANMDKDFSDKTIIAYLKKIYGFSLTKTMDIDEAEELSAMITLEVYKSLLKVEKIDNIDGYVYRIAHNVYARFIKEKMSAQTITNEEKDSLIYDLQNNNNDEILNKIRSEITYLSKIQREIVVMHYFEKQKLKDIAAKLNLPLGSVCWHLRDARKNIKEGFREELNDSYNNEHITFDKMRNIGYLGPLCFDMSFYLNKKLTQNIAYATYHCPKSVIELAKELNVPAAFIEDEINHLLKNGFLVKLASNKYQTNIYINDIKDKDYYNKKNEIYANYAKLIYDYLKILAIDMSTNNNFFNDEKKIYSPKNDKNFLLWSLITFACSILFKFKDKQKEILKYHVRRRDDGFYVASANIKHNTNLLSLNNYFKPEENTYVNHYQDIYPIKLYTFNSFFDKRDINQKTKYPMLFETLYDFISGKIIKCPANIDKYIKLYDNELIIRESLDNDYVNMIICTLTETELLDMFPPIPKEIISIGNELDDLIYNLDKEYYPSQMHALCNIFSQNTLANVQIRVHILENLLKHNIIKPIKKKQIKTVNLIMFTDILPTGV